ncbi:MAG: beta-1,6-N-acetylglucosaminyltransferase [Endomicrobiaceae bacterium]|jgi:hypothetical protein|nr:beta-1,6-N-acetylglucosaminyltransferase [Endomicrobiaceae bacterium]MDD3729451.1 beta-1,6-N-acetylglucosaminyltransferase [Endomicrobiaceae bacterium]MDD4165602.1 beta-1,6-N-acetylglucosaminyltransferase [Endomicrobiaceae bacterium]
MKLAILLLCHKNPDQINKFLEVMRHSQIVFFIHIDKKNNFAEQIVKRDDVYVLPDNFCQDIQWGNISMVQATLNLIEFALSKNLSFDYFWLCSGQDFPIKPVKEIINFLENKTDNFINLFNSKNSVGKYSNYDKRNSLYYPAWIMGNSLFQRILKRIYVIITGGYKKTYFLNRKNSTKFDFYFGSQWWCLNNKTIKWIMAYCKDNNEYYEFHKNCVVPDESFFHTLVLNSPFAKDRKDYLHYIDWSDSGNSPKTLTLKDLDKIVASPFLMARKLDFQVDKNLFQIIINRIL